jgi:hypothetical protein
MVDPSGEAQARGGLSELEKIVAELERLREIGDWDWAALDALSSETRVLFEVMMIEALTSWPLTARRRLRASLIVNGYDEQCARRMMSDNLPDSIRASALYSMLRPCSDTAPLMLPDGLR